MGAWLGWGIISLLFGWAGYLAWAEYRMHHPKEKPPKGNNIKGPLR